MRAGSPPPASGPDRVPAFCPNCGAANTSGGLRCVVCGQQFLTREEVHSAWDVPGARPQPPSMPPVYGNPNDYDQGEMDVEEEEPYDPNETVQIKPVTDRWASSAGRLAADPGAPDAFVVPESDEKNRHGSGPPGFLLGCLGLLLIAAVGVATLLLVVKPMLSTNVESRTHKAVSTSLANLSVLPTPGAGTVVITESQIRSTLRSHSADLKPIEDPAVSIANDGFSIDFKIYGISTTVSGQLGAKDGRIVILNPKLSGVGQHLLNVDTIASDIEAQLNTLLVSNSLRVVSVKTSNNTITLTTEPAPVTPIA